MTRYGPHHRDATTAAVRNSYRYVVTQRRMALVIGVLVRIGNADQLLPRTKDVGLARSLEKLAAVADPKTEAGAAILATVARSSKNFGAWIRRNRERVQQMILDAKKAEGPPP